MKSIKCKHPWSFRTFVLNFALPSLRRSRSDPLGIHRCPFGRKKEQGKRRRIHKRPLPLSLNRLLLKQLSLVSILTGRGRETLRSSESFFDNSNVRLRCKSKTRPSGSNSWIYGRFAVLRIVSEKILIRAQGSLPRPASLPLKGTLLASQSLFFLLSVVSVVSCNDPSTSPD
jgi:hypothetical protein